ncbi:MAG TPA: thioredoxin family protein [Pseudomonadales bacterium]
MRRKGLYAFLGGVVLGLAAYHGALLVSDRIPIHREYLNDQAALVREFREENLELADELFGPRDGGNSAVDPGGTPYDEEADGASVIHDARANAYEEGKFLMVTFGANWCLDCRILHHHLSSEPVADYARDIFEFVFVDIGSHKRNRAVAESLGVTLENGIPVAVFYDPRGAVIGTTNDGELEPSRFYSSTQILKFIKDISERGRISAPDSVD